MIKYLKYLKWDLQTSPGRFAIALFFLRSIPGRFGMELRSCLLRRYLTNVSENLRVHEGIHIRNIEKLFLGNNVTIGVNNFIQAAGGITIGDNVLLGPDVKIWSANHIFKDLSLPIIEQGYEFKEVSIGNNVWIGANSFIMPGARIGDGVIISAGSVVGAKNIPPNSILAGNPARKIGSRTND